MNTFRSNDPVNPAMLVLARELRGLTQEEVAEQSGIPLDTLQHYETVGGVLPTGHVYRLARGYDVPIPFFQRAGELHQSAHICVEHHPADDLLIPLQLLLDAYSGDDHIMQAEWGEDGIYVCQYETDEDNRPFASLKLGNTVRQAGIQLRKLLKAESLQRK